MPLLAGLTPLLQAGIARRHRKSTRRLQIDPFAGSGRWIQTRFDSPKVKGDQALGARQKLNSAHFMGSLIVAGLVGVVTQSGAVFVGVLFLLLISSFHGGGIRLSSRR